MDSGLTGLRTSVTVDVRYFAAARAAAGVEQETIELPDGTSLAGLVVELGRRDQRLATTLERCSYLRDSVAVRDMRFVLCDGQVIDVLPPFAGG